MLTILPRQSIANFAAVLKWDEGQHPRNKAGEFTDKTATMTVDGREITVTKPHGSSTDVLVPIDVAKFEAAYQRRKDFYIAPGAPVGPGHGAIHGRYDRFGEFIAKSPTMDAPDVAINADGENSWVDFGNGRHRFAWLRDHGVKTIPMVMDRKSLKNAQKFGYIAAEKWDESQHPRDAEGQFAQKPSLEERYPVEPYVGGGFAVKLPGGGLIAVIQSRQSKGGWVVGGQPHTYATSEDAILEARLLAASKEPKPKPPFTSHTAEEAEQVIAKARAEGQRVLFHSGDASIAAELAEGIQPQMGSWVEEVLAGATDDEEALRQIQDDPENAVAYYSETPGWVSMKASRVIEGKHVTEVTPEELEQHGHLSVVVVDADDETLLTSDENQLVYRMGSDESRQETIPFGVEPGDIYTKEALVPAVTLTGKELLRFLNRNYPQANLLKGTLEAFKWDESSDYVEKRDYSYSNTQIEIAVHSAAALSLNMARDVISESDLMGHGKDVDPNHITVRYGLLEDAHITALRQFIANQTAFVAEVSGVELFPASEHSDGAVPVVARISSPELHAIEAEIGKYGKFKEKSFPDYKPHCTLAYVKPEAAHFYKHLVVTGTFTVQSITISHSSGVQETIPFGWTQRVQKKQWDERKHPRNPAGSANAGEFTEVIYGPRDAHDSLMNGEKATIDPNDLQRLLEIALEENEDSNLLRLHLDGMDVFDRGGLGIKREDMPQIPRDHRDSFLQELRDAGIEVTKEWVDPFLLKTTQDEVSSRNVAEKIEKYKKGDRSFPPLLVSSENRMLDGHHHWGMIVAFGVEIAPAKVKVPIYRLHVPTRKALALMTAYGKKHNLQRKALDTKYDPSQPRDAQGQWVSIGRALSKTGRVTVHPKETAFLLPDGTRISAAGYNAHAKLARMAGYNDLQKVIASGIVRYIPGVGIEAHSLTREQAKIVVDDWESEFAGPNGWNALQVDLIGEDDRGVFSTTARQFDRLTVEGLLNFVNKKQKVAADNTGRYVTPFVSFDKQGDNLLRMIASLNSSRLATWGFTAEAEVRGLQRYRITAVLDGRTSKFCRFIDGKIFEVSDAREKVIEALNVQDPEDLRVVQPWPKQTKAAMAEFRMMSAAELTERGLHIPPYHPYCRTLLKAIESSKDLTAPTTPTIPAQAEAFHEVTVENLKELGIVATQEQVDQWNAHVGMSPTELLSKFTGMAPQEVMTKGKGVGTVPVQFDKQGNIGVKAHGEVNGVEFALGALLDPFTGIYYLTKADLLAGTPAAELKFLKTLFTGFIEMGLRSTATSLAVGVAGNAAYYAKMGFLPDEGEWDVLRAYTAGELETGALQPVLASLKAEDAQLVLHLLKDRSVGALQALVDLPFMYRGKSIGEWLFGETAGTWSLDLTNELMVAQALAYL